MRGGVLETDRVKQARREEVQWCRGMGVLEPALRKDVDAEGVSLRWVDTDKGDAAMRIDQTAGLERSCERSKRP